MQLTFNGHCGEGRKQLIDALSTLNSTKGTQHVSLYFKRFSPELTDKIRKEISLAENIKSKETKTNVKESLSSILLVLKTLQEGQAGAVFAYKKDSYLIKLPVALTTDYYRCDKEFYLEPLKGINQLKWGLVVLDTKRYSIGVITNSKIRLLKTEDVYVAGKIKAGGQSSQRFEQSRRKQIEHYISKLSDTVMSVLKAENVEKILLGGVYPTTDLFYRNNSMHASFKTILQRPVSVIYTDQHGLEQLLEKQKDKFESALKNYYLEVQGAENYIKQRTTGRVYKLEQLIGVKIGPITGGYHVDNSDPSFYYCEDCGLITPKLCTISTHHCQRIKDLLTKLKPYKFSSETSRGAQMKQLFQSGVALNTRIL